MKAIPLALLVGLNTVAAIAADGEKHVSKEGRFAIAFPKDAKVKTDTKKHDSGVTFTLVAAETQGSLYGVVYSDLPETELKNLKTFFDSVERGLLRKTGLKILESKEMEFGPNKTPARSVLSEKDGTQARLVLFVKGTRMYGITLRGSKEFIESKEATAFFDSFELK